MIIRIVKMTFQASLTEEFEALFNEVKEQIAGFEGCSYLALWKDEQDERVYFTHSHWEDAASLEAYRHSLLFKETWKKTRAMFEEKPQAWSVVKKWSKA